LYFMADIKFRKYMLILGIVFISVAFIFYMSDLFAKDECGFVISDLNDTSFQLVTCLDELSFKSDRVDDLNYELVVLEDELGSCNETNEILFYVIDEYNLTGKIPVLSRNIGFSDVIHSTIFGKAKLWMVLILIPAMFFYTFLRLVLRLKIKKGVKILLWLDLAWLIVVLIYIFGVIV
jgi:hypothetical protein